MSATENYPFSGNKQYNLESYKLNYIPDSTPTLIIYFKLPLMLTSNKNYSKTFGLTVTKIHKTMNQFLNIIKGFLKSFVCDISFYHFCLLTAVVLYTSVVPPPVFGLGRLSRGRVLPSFLIYSIIF